MSNKNWITFNGNHSFRIPDPVPETVPDVTMRNGANGETIIIVKFPDKEIVKRNVNNEN
tara:strand:- start:5712 stop:5888 length:177 start_codon:yes stop_codon:yes gene_type:complete